MAPPVIPAAASAPPTAIFRRRSLKIILCSLSPNVSAAHTISDKAGVLLGNALECPPRPPSVGFGAGEFVAQEVESERPQAEGVGVEFLEVELGAGACLSIGAGVEPDPFTDLV